MTESFYDVLGVEPDAEEAEIRRAYRERLKETHPDVNDDPDADVHTKRLVEAKETLLDRTERARYDRLGHDTYVAAGADAVDGGATDRATGTNAGGSSHPGAATGDRDWSSGTTDGDGDPTNARAGPWERQAREQEARDHVDTDATGTDATTGGRPPTDSTASVHDRTAGRTVSWAESGFDATVEPGDVKNRAPWLTLGESPATIVAALVLYPVLVGGAVFPPFPLWVNVFVGICIVCVVAALQSMPGVGVVVFATWSMAGTFALAAASVSPFTLVGLLVVVTTWFPLGLTLLTAWILRA